MGIGYEVKIHMEKIQVGYVCYFFYSSMAINHCY